MRLSNDFKFRSHNEEITLNYDFGFKCLHYKGYADSNSKITVTVINKNKVGGKVRISTKDGEAKDQDDYEGCN